MENRIDELFDKPCYVMDFLPQKVSEADNGHFLMLNITYLIVNSAMK